MNYPYFGDFLRTSYFIQIQIPDFLEKSGILLFVKFRIAILPKYFK